MGVGLAGTLCSCGSPSSVPPAQTRVVLPSPSPAPVPTGPPSPAELTAAEHTAHLDSGDIKAHLRLADLYLRAGKQPEAASTLRIIVRTQPRSAEAYRRLAALYRAAGYPDREYEALRSLTACDPNDWQSTLRLADVALEQRWFDIATPMLAQAAHAAPREPRVFIEQATSSFLLHDWPQMEISTRQGLKLAPDNAELWVALSDACRLQGRLPEAEQALRTAMAHTTAPTITVRHNARLAHLLLEPGWKPARTADAAQAALTALQRSPEDVEARYWLARAQELQGQAAEAETNYLRAAQQDIQFESLPFYLGNLDRRSSDPNKRREGERLLTLYQAASNNASEFSHVGEILRQKLNDPAAHRNMAGAYLKFGHVPQAIMELHRALELNPRDTEARHRLGQTLHAEGRISEAKKYEH